MILYDLNFVVLQYENVYFVMFKNLSQVLQVLLREMGLLLLDEERKQFKKGGEGSKKKKMFDVEKMVDGLVKLSEDDLLQVIQLIYDGKDEGMFIQNNVDQGEFLVDLYMLLDLLMKVFWDYLVSFCFGWCLRVLVWFVDSLMDRFVLMFLGGIKLIFVGFFFGFFLFNKLWCICNGVLGVLEDGKRREDEVCGF